MSTTVPENGGDRRSLMRPPSIAFDHFRCFSFSCLVRVRRRRSRHTSRGAHRRPSLVRARGREPPKWVRLPLLFQLMALLRAIVHGSSSVPPFLVFVTPFRKLWENSSKFYFVVEFSLVKLFYYFFVENLYVFSNLCFHLYLICRNHLTVLTFVHLPINTYSISITQKSVIIFFQICILGGR
jgi:hypothetical protein